jgi:hypothetical protein
MVAIHLMLIFSFCASVQHFNCEICILNERLTQGRCFSSQCRRMYSILYTLPISTSEYLCCGRRRSTSSQIRLPLRNVQHTEGLYSSLPFTHWEISHGSIEPLHQCGHRTISRSFPSLVWYAIYYCCFCSVFGYPPSVTLVYTLRSTMQLI